MNKILYIPLLFILFIGCKKDDALDLATPSDVSTLTAKSVVGGVVLHWSLPEDSNFTYVEVRYIKKDKEERVLVSKHADSVLIEGLLSSLKYQFSVQTVHENKDGKVYGANMLTSEAINPIRRPIETVFYKHDIKNNMVDAWTQEATEGPKVNLTDGDVNTYWHSAWSAGVEPLPHWIKVTFAEQSRVDRIGYYFRQGRTATSGRPEKIAFETSDNGTDWERVWTSDKLNISNEVSKNEQLINLDKTYESKYVRVLFLEVNGTTNYVNLGEFALYHKEDTDLEKEAEKNY